jgi:hypothetical protein
MVDSQIDFDYKEVLKFNYIGEMMKILKDKLDYFHGTVVFGLNKQDESKMVAVYRKGAMLNDKNFPKFTWSEKTYDKEHVRIHFIAPNEVEMLTKSEIKKEMDVSNLKSQQSGFKIYEDTPIGDVLYITCETYRQNWKDAIQQGFFDKARGINLKKVA